MAGGISGFLHTEGNQIVDAAGQRVKLTGVNWFGGEGFNYIPTGLWSNGYRSMLDQMKGAGFNVVRLPWSDATFDSQAVTNGIDYSKNPDLAGLTRLQVYDRIIGYAGQIGMKVILDHHRSDGGAGPNETGLWYSQAHPESAMIANWTMLAQRYKGNDAVIGADLHNEPHGGVTWGGGNPATDWAAAAERVGNAIQSVNSDWLLLVEGLEWSSTLDGVRNRQIHFDTPGRLVYSPHVYAHSVYTYPWLKDPAYPNNLPAQYDGMWGYIYRNGIAPVLIGEFGGRMTSDAERTWADALVKYMNGDWNLDGQSDLAAGQQGMSWTYWAWTPESGDVGGLLNADYRTLDQTKIDLIRPGLYTGPAAPDRQDVGVYRFPTVSDAPLAFPAAVGDGGTIDASNQSAPAVIDLTPGAFSSIGSRSDGSVAVRNLSIPAGTLFANAVGGSGNDAIRGNAAANALDGGGGDDTLFGGAGGDTLTGGTGADWVTLDAAGGRAWLSGVETLLGGAGADRADLGDGGNRLVVAAVETLVGGAGGDWIELGNRGNTLILAAVETLVGGSGSDRVELGNRGNTLVLTAVETLLGGSGTDVVTLGNRGNTIAVSGVETILGGVGSDDVTLTGGPAYVRTGRGSDTVTLSAGADRIAFGGADNGGAPGAAEGYDDVFAFQPGIDQVIVTNTLKALVDHDGDGGPRAARRAAGTADFRTDEVVELTVHPGILVDEGFAALRRALGTVAAAGGPSNALVLSTNGTNSGLYWIGDDGDGVIAAAEVRLLARFRGSVLSADDIRYG